ncbi:MAG TPA: thioredoxin-disulfide reductase [Candidatus Eisenbacteria bacterium]|nr:thioredoxin-disulfide reductase [Candidatus Eisenbacteria bacterium]
MNTTPMENLYDVIIVGSGPAGLTAAIYATRASLKTVILAGTKWGGQLQLTTEVENFPGFEDGIQGPDLMLKMRKQAEKFGAEFVQADMDATDFSKMGAHSASSGSSSGPFTVTANGKTYTGKTLLIATGADAKTLGVPGEGALTGHGVSYCATCDGAFFRNKNIIVVGGGDSAMEEAQFLTNFAAKVTLVHRRDEFKASEIMTDRCKKNPKIEFLLNSQVVEVKGEGRVQSVTIENTTSHEKKDMPIDGVFVAIGHIPNSKVFQGIEMNERGFVRSQDGTRTNIDGIFVSGDVEDSRYMQAITAAGFGCMAALDIERYLAEKK